MSQQQLLFLCGLINILLYIFCVCVNGGLFLIKFLFQICLQKFLFHNYVNWVKKKWIKKIFFLCLLDLLFHSYRHCKTNLWPMGMSKHHLYESSCIAFVFFHNVTLTFGVYSIFTFLPFFVWVFGLKF